MAVTRNDVARAAGVSSAVVSYVLNEGPRPVSADARQRVLAAVAALGYRRDGIARSMRTGRTESIGLILPDIGLSYFAAMTQRITEEAHRRGRTLVVAVSNGKTELEREHLAELAARRVDGVILMSVDPTRELDWAGTFGIPVLVVDRPAVATEGIAEAIHHLVAHGRTDIARVAAPAEYSITTRRDSGWTRALREHGIPDTTERIVRVEVSERAGYEAGLVLLRRESRPNAVIADSAPHAFGLLRAAADLGIRIPDDVMVIAAEVGPSGDFTVPSLSSIDSPIDAIAQAALDRIIDASRDDTLLSLSGTEFALHGRESCGHPRTPIDRATK